MELDSLDRSRFEGLGKGEWETAGFARVEIEPLDALVGVVCD